MTRYLISLGAHAMDHIPAEEMPAVAGPRTRWSKRPSTLPCGFSAADRKEGAGTGCQDRQRLPLRGTGLGVHARPRNRRDAPPGR